MKRIRRLVRYLADEQRRAEKQAAEEKRRERQQARNVKRGVVPRKPEEVDLGMATNWEQALEQSERIVELIDDEVPDWAKNTATNFFEDIREKAVSVGETISRTKRVTEGQQNALDGWERGVRKWIK
jgi:hypothetical protein